MLRFMSADSDVTEAHFRIAFRVAQFVHAKTGWAKVGDATLIDHLPRTDAKKLRNFRRALESLGWIRTIEGERGRPTRYLFLDTRIPEIEKRLADAAEKREVEFALRNAREHSEAKAVALQVQLTGRISPLIDRPKAGNLCPDKGAISPPLLPKRSTYGDSTSRVQDVAKGPTRTEPALCIDCGAPAVVEQRHALGGKLWPFCQEHKLDAPVIEERPIPLNGNSPSLNQERADPDDAYRASSWG
ncbi:hypothetical protein FV230_07395 [Methylobacterium sp. WL6]|nr:hypothetical protein FV230_07395 [Methylobacterium sp. WL6]